MLRRPVEATTQTGRSRYTSHLRFWDVLRDEVPYLQALVFRSSDRFAVADLNVIRNLVVSDVGEKPKKPLPFKRGMPDFEFEQAEFS